MNFVTPSRKARFAQLDYLFKHTFTIFVCDASIVRLISKMSLYACVMLCIFAAGLLCTLYERTGTGTLLMVIGVLLNFYRYFYYSRVSLVLSRMVYISASEGEPTA